VLLRLVQRKNYRDILLGFCILAATCALIAHPDLSAQSVRDGLSLCGNVILPSLFPFFVLSSLVIELGMSRYLGRLLEPVMRPLFRVNGTCAAALALGFIGGYPVGARTAIQLYESGQCSRTEAERLLAFCNNCGPAFIFGVVGAGIFNNSKVGMILYLTHMCASLLVGFLFRFYHPHDLPHHAKTSSAQFLSVRFSAAFSHSVLNALQSSLNICGFIVIFTVILRMFAFSGILSALSAVIVRLLTPLHLSHLPVQQLLAGLLELSSGVSALTEGSVSGRVPIAAFMLGWAGLSVHLQVIAFMGDSKLSVRTYLTGKLLHGLLSALLARLALRFLSPDIPIPVYLSEQAITLSTLDFSRVITISAACSCGLWIMFFLLVCYVVKKSSRKRTRHAL